MSAQRRTALVSVAAAALLVTIKLATAFATHSLGLFSEAIHSGTDLVAALLTLFAVGLAVRPADRQHQYGHGKAEHLAALAEGVILVAASVLIISRAAGHLVGGSKSPVDPAWYAFAALAVVIALDLSRVVVSMRAARRFDSAAFAANALHFGGDMAGSIAVLIGLGIARAGYPNGDSVAALFVAVLVLGAAFRLMKANTDVLMDRAPAAATEAARAAVLGLELHVELRRLRVRHVAGKHFADVVIGVSSTAVVGQGHEAADRVEAAIQLALPGADVVVHVEPLADEDTQVRERAHAAALQVARVREIHNVTVLDVDGHCEVSLHLKLPGEMALDEAHAVAEEVERAILAAVDEVDSVQTHLEPLTEEGRGEQLDGGDTEVDRATVERIVEGVIGAPPRELRFLRTTEGRVLFLTLGLEPGLPLAEAHARASAVEERIRGEIDVIDVIVHTEP
jgi:cation diffusion facilitator family transporter